MAAVAEPFQAVETKASSLIMDDEEIKSNTAVEDEEEEEEEEENEEEEEEEEEENEENEEGEESSKQSRSEKKARKAMQKLGMKPVQGNNNSN